MTGGEVIVGPRSDIARAADALNEQLRRALAYMRTHFYTGGSIDVGGIGAHRLHYVHVHDGSREASFHVSNDQWRKDLFACSLDVRMRAAQAMPRLVTELHATNNVAPKLVDEHVVELRKYLNKLEVGL